MNNEYLSIMNEYYDLSDPYTNNKIILCTEAEKETNLENLANRLYMHIRDHTADIDFGTIPKSKGDITKIDNFDNLIDCINNLRDLIAEYGEKTDLVDTVSTAVDNIINRKAIFEKAFNLNIDFPILIYNTMTLSCVSSISILISTCVEYVKNKDESIHSALDKAKYRDTKNHVLFKSLYHFNNECMGRNLDTFMNGCIKANLTRIKEAYDQDPKYFDVMYLEESGLGFVIHALKYAISMKWIFDSLLYMIRRSIYYYYYQRQKVADYFTIQADYLQLNAENLKYREDLDHDEKKREEIKRKQLVWVDRFRKIANFMMLKDKKSQKSADEQANREDREREKYPNNNDDGDMF